MARILVSDDEVGPREDLRILLERDHQVVLVPGGLATLAELENAPFDLLITDLMNPHMDGITLIAAAKSRCPRIRTMVVSAADPKRSCATSTHLQPIAAQLEQEGVDAYVRKPFDLKTLRDAVQYTLTADPLAPVKDWS